MVLYGVGHGYGGAANRARWRAYARNDKVNAGGDRNGGQTRPRVIPLVTLHVRVRGVRYRAYVVGAGGHVNRYLEARRGGARNSAGKTADCPLAKVYVR